MLKKMSGMVCYVEDVAEAVEFYRKLGFRVDRNESDHGSVELGDFWIDFHPGDKEDKPEFQKEAVSTPRGLGVFHYFLVDDADKTYRELLEKGLKPSSQPRDWPWGNREFAIRDPNGYKLVFYHVLNR